jgi:hypothetical protein
MCAFYATVAGKINNLASDFEETAFKEIGKGKRS